MKKTLITLFALGSVFLSTAHGQNRVFSMVTGHGFEDIYNFGFGMRIGKNLTIHGLHLQRAIGTVRTHCRVEHIHKVGV